MNTLRCILLWTVTITLTIPPFGSTNAAEPGEPAAARVVHAALEARPDWSRRLTAEPAKGCCVFHGNPVRCNYGTREYCETLAERHSLAFDFHQGISCRNVSRCPAR